MERRRVVIDKVWPEVDCGRYPVKRVVGEKVAVEADVFADGHDVVRARLLYRGPVDGEWRSGAMAGLGNDRWKGEFMVEEMGTYHYTIEGWIDPFKTWQSDIAKKSAAGKLSGVDMLVGAGLVEEVAGRAAGKKDRSRLMDFAETLKEENELAETLKVALGDELTGLMDSYPAVEFATRYSRELMVMVDRTKALFSTWYERFPRSCSPESGGHGSFRDCERLLSELSRLGFDVLYLPPIHPIGVTSRKGGGNRPVADPGDVGSPWAIGSSVGGHKSIHPDLGTIEDFERLVGKAAEQGLEVAMDLAFQCSPDHPYVKEHPEWFIWRPDGTVQYAENPPKKYEDIIPLNFTTGDWRGLWEELKSVVLFWIDKGVRIFRVDNPHTKPFPFWEWLIGEIKGEYPEVIFLSEAFTRPKVKYRLAKVGFTQSYTYFTWRNTKGEIVDYMSELTSTEISEYFRPNFWPNTPDILPEHLQFGGKPAFIARLVLAATLSSNYGVYGPAFELLIDEAVDEKEEYVGSEKYELKSWDWDRPGNIKSIIARVNRIRRQNKALQQTRNLKFLESDNEFVICYMKTAEEPANIILVMVNLDPYHTQSSWVELPVEELGVGHDQPYMVHDLLSDDKYIWQGGRNFVVLNPHIVPAHIFRIRKRLRSERDFDYFM